MKRFLSMALSCLLFAALTSPALANEYGLRGGIYDIVTSSDRYEGYSCPGSGADSGNRRVQERYVNQAILENRYHRLLIAAWRDGQVWKTDAVSTTAVYQPGDPRGEYPNHPVVRHDGNGFSLSYGENEQYYFVWKDGQYVLHTVKYDITSDYGDSYLTSDDGFQFWQSGMANTFVPIGDAIWLTDGITLEEFNITQTPRSLSELRRLNAVRTLLDESEGTELAITAVSGEKKGQKLAVYSAPEKSSYRSSSGKAAMSTGGAYGVLGVEDGWTLISYEVSPRTSRIGYVQATLAEGAELVWKNVALVTAVDTFLTDDPLVSQYAQTYIPAGTEVTGLSRLGEYYAHVAWEQDGQPIRGFVPLKDLQPKYDRVLSAGDDLLYADIRWDVMDALIGKWDERGSSDRSRMIFYSGGAYRNHMPGDGSRYREEGNFRVYDGENGDYELYICTEDNVEYCYTLTLNQDGSITVISEDGSVIRTLHRDEYSSIGNG